MFAHDVGGGALPAPPWLLSYIGVAFVLGTAAVLRASWPTARLAGTDATSAAPPRPAPVRVGLGTIAGLVALAAAASITAAALLVLT